VDLRVRDLLSRMTLEEKVGQIIALWATKAQIMDDLTFSPQRPAPPIPPASARSPGHRTGAGRPMAPRRRAGSARWRSPEDTVRFINAVQTWAKNETRLGIPVLFHEEALHGYMATDATMFPMAIGLAGSFDRDLMRESSR
jgi:beta-glucosidase